MTSPEEKTSKKSREPHEKIYAWWITGGFSRSVSSIYSWLVNAANVPDLSRLVLLGLGSYALIVLLLAAILNNFALDPTYGGLVLVTAAICFAALSLTPRDIKP